MTDAESDQFEPTVEETHEAIFILDVDERIVEVNDQAYRSLCCECDGEIGDRLELIGSRWSEFVALTGDCYQESSPFDVLQESSKTVISVDGRVERMDGSTFRVRVHIARTDHDGVGEFLAIVRDISNLVDEQQQLRHQKERLDQFASVISHDLRSPLSVARAGVEVARRTEELEGDSLERVSRAHDRMETLINELVSLARSSGQMDATDIEPVELSTVVTKSWNTVSTEGAELCVEDDFTFFADESRLRQLVENLLRNSVDHGLTDKSREAAGSPEATVTIRVGSLADGFYIEDDGPGIPEADRKIVFEPGYTTQKDGIGYGLEIVRTVAEAHNWVVRITDSTEGGARFEFSGVDVVDPAAQDR